MPLPSSTNNPAYGYWTNLYDESVCLRLKPATCFDYSESADERVMRLEREEQDRFMSARNKGTPQ